MKNVKKTIAVLLIVLLSISALPISAFAAPYIVDYGACGQNATYLLYNDGTLYIDGTGDMYDYRFYYSDDDYDNGITTAPWGEKYLFSVYINSGITRIGTCAFFGCTYLATISLPYGITDIGDYAFRGCINLKSVTIPDSVTNIGTSAFGRCLKLSNIILSDSVKTIGDYLFYKCSGLSSVSIGNSIMSIPQCTFAYCSQLENVTLGNHIKLIGESAFLSCKRLTEIDIPASVTSITDYAFLGCSALTTVTLTKNIKSIGCSAFDEGLAEILFHGTLEEWLNINIDPDNDGISYATLYYNYHNYKNVTKKATLTENGSITPICTECGAKDTATKIYKASNIKISKTKLSYNGEVQKPKVIVKDSTGKTISTKYYTVTWSNASSKTVGKYTVTVTFKGNYSGKKTLTYTIVPKAVTGVKAASSTTKSIKLSWTKATGAKYYEVYGSTDGKTFKKITTVSTNTAKITKVNGKALSAGKTYSFKVRALDSTKKLTGAYSKVLKTGTLTAAPKITKLTSTKSKTATVTWGKVTGAKSYVVYKSTDGKKWTKVASTTKTTYTLTKLTGGKPIYVKVLAVNAYKANSDYSAVKSVTVK